MISFTCADSFSSSRAIISSIVSSTSSLMTVVSASASRTRVVTAFSTSVAARSLRGLKLCLRSVANSSGSRVSTSDFPCRASCLRHQCPLRYFFVVSLGVCRARRRRAIAQRGHQLGILQAAP